MTEAVIVDAIRTPGGKRNGKLKDQHPAHLAAEVLKALAERNNLDPADVDDVIMGCVMQVGEQSLNIGRNAVLAAGWGLLAPAWTGVALAIAGLGIAGWSFAVHCRQQTHAAAEAPTTTDGVPAVC